MNNALPPDFESLNRTEQLEMLLARRYPPPVYAFLPQVRNGTGFKKEPRTADALAMNLWPSRGLELIGFELKTYRGDWTRELHKPEKAEDHVNICDRWYIVAGAPEIVKPEELPPTWGLLVRRGKAQLVEVTAAPKLDAQPMDRLLLAAILRRAQEVLTPQARVDAAVRRARDEERKTADLRIEREREDAKENDRSLRRRVEEFERISGIMVSGDLWHLGTIAEAVRLLTHDYPEPLRALRDIRAAAERILKHLNDEALAGVPVALAAQSDEPKATRV